MDDRRDRASSCRDGETDKMLQVSRADVEPCEPHCPADREGKGRSPTEAVVQRREAPDKSEDRWRDPERDDIGKRIELETEIRSRVHHAGDTAIEHVQHDCNSDSLGGMIVIPSHCRYDRKIAAENISDGEY